MRFWKKSGGMDKKVEKRKLVYFNKKIRSAKLI